MRPAAGAAGRRVAKPAPAGFVADDAEDRPSQGLDERARPGEVAGEELLGREDDGHRVLARVHPFAPQHGALEAVGAGAGRRAEAWSRVNAPSPRPAPGPARGRGAPPRTFAPAAPAGQRAWTAAATVRGESSRAGRWPTCGTSSARAIARGVGSRGRKVSSAAARPSPTRAPMSATRIAFCGMSLGSGERRLANGVEQNRPGARRGRRGRGPTADARTRSGSR